MPIPSALSATAGAALSATNTLPKIGGIYRAVNGGHVRVRLLNEAASQTFDRGELVSLDASGNVTNLFTTADSTANTATFPNTAVAQATPSTMVAGMILKAATNGSASTDKSFPLVEAGENVEFLIRVYNSTSTSAETQDVKVGDNAEITRYFCAGISSVRDAQTVCSAAPNATDGKNHVVIVEIPSEHGATDTYPPVWVRVRPEACAYS